MTSYHGSELQVSNGAIFFSINYRLIQVGVHGRPYTSWNGAQQMPGAPTTGYCTHCKCSLNSASKLPFPTADKTTY